MLDATLKEIRLLIRKYFGTYANVIIAKGVDFNRPDREHGFDFNQTSHGENIRVAIYTFYLMTMGIPLSTDNRKYVMKFFPKNWKSPSQDALTGELFTIEDLLLSRCGWQFDHIDKLCRGTSFEYQYDRHVVSNLRPIYRKNEGLTSLKNMTEIRKFLRIQSRNFEGIRSGSPPT